MNTRHVPSLELCQEFDRLCKEKGIVVPPTMFGWQKEGSEYVLHYFEDHKSYKDIPAPLVSEQGEWLPAFIKGKRLQTDKMPDSKSWMVCYLPLNEEDEEWAELGTNEANARQKMLNYLIIEGVITNL